MDYTNLFTHLNNSHLLLNIDKRLNTNTELFIDQFNSYKILKSDVKTDNSNSFPNYEVIKELSSEFKIFDAAYKVLLAKFHLVETLNTNMVNTYGFKSIFD